MHPAPAFDGWSKLSIMHHNSGITLDIFKFHFIPSDTSYILHAWIKLLLFRDQLDPSGSFTYYINCI